MRRKYFGWELAFQYLWENADEDGLWNGSEAHLATEFAVSEDDAYSVLSDLCDRNLVEKVANATYAIVKSREREEFRAEHHSRDF